MPNCALLLVVERIVIICIINFHSVEPYLSRDVLDCLVDDDPGRHERFFIFRIRNKCNLVIAAVATEERDVVTIGRLGVDI